MGIPELKGNQEKVIRIGEKSQEDHGSEKPRQKRLKHRNGEQLSNATERSTKLRICYKGHIQELPVIFAGSLSGKL